MPIGWIIPDWLALYSKVKHPSKRYIYKYIAINYNKLLSLNKLVQKFSNTSETIFLITNKIIIKKTGVLYDLYSQPPKTSAFGVAVGEYFSVCKTKWRAKNN